MHTFGNNLFKNKYKINIKFLIPPLNTVIVISAVWVGGRECPPAFFTPRRKVV